MRRSRAAGWGALLLAWAIVPVMLGWAAYSFRSAAVDCQRVDGRATCSVVERVGGWVVWSAGVQDVASVRAALRGGSGPRGVMAVAGAGAEAPLTSGVLADDQVQAIASRVRAWLEEDADAEALSFTQPPSLANAAIGVGIALLAALWGLVALQRVRRAAARAASRGGARRRASRNP